jgi:hypothetical protein
MSLLGSQVYGNSTTPLWIGAGGGTIAESLSLKAPNGELLLTDATGVTIGRIAAEPPNIPSPPPGEGVVYIQSDYAIAFYRLGFNQGNTILYPATAYGDDVFQVGGELKCENLGISTGVMTGFDEILVGQTNVVVISDNILAGDIILFTRPGAAVAGPGNGPGQGQVTFNPANIIPGTSFQVDLVDPATGIVVAASGVNAQFQWVIMRPY